jgi:hypothetical protein
LGFGEGFEFFFGGEYFLLETLGVFLYEGGIEVAVGTAAGESKGEKEEGEKGE